MPHRMQVAAGGSSLHNARCAQQVPFNEVFFQTLSLVPGTARLLLRPSSCIAACSATSSRKAGGGCRWSVAAAGCVAPVHSRVGNSVGTHRAGHRMSAFTDRPLYFRSFEAALRPPASGGGVAGWSGITERALQLLETPWPWDTSCTSMGVCPAGAACAQTTGFAIICAQGIVRDSVEPALEAARAWWPAMLGGASHSEANLVIVAVVAIVLINLMFFMRAVASRRSSCQPHGGGVSSADGGDATSRRQKDAAARRRSRRSRHERASSSFDSESSDGDGSDESEEESEIVAYKTE